MDNLALANQPPVYSDTNNLTSGGGAIEGIENTLFDENTNAQSDSVSEPVINPRTNTETILSLGVLAFGILLVFFTGIVAFRKNTGWDSEATRIFTVAIIVTAGLFLITAGYGDQQIAPMFGLMGTMVGYLLGKTPPGEQPTKPGQ